MTNAYDYGYGFGLAFDAEFSEQQHPRGEGGKFSSGGGGGGGGKGKQEKADAKHEEAGKKWEAEHRSLNWERKRPGESKEEYQARHKHLSAIHDKQTKAVWEAATPEEKAQHRDKGGVDWDKVRKRAGLESNNVVMGRANAAYLAGKKE